MGNPVFIIGCDRSGTTLLNILLGQSPDLHMTLESGFIPKLYENKGEYGDFSLPKQRWFFIRDLQTTNANSKSYAFEKFKISDEEANAAIAEVAPTDYSGAINALFSKAAQKKDKKRWGDKTPNYTNYTNLLSKLFPDLKIIHIIRDPRDVVASMIRAGWYHGGFNGYKAAALKWENMVRNGLDARNLGEEQYYEIKYEALLLNPHEELKEVYEWLGISLRDDVTESYLERGKENISKKHNDLHYLIGKPIDPSRAFAWKENMNKADIGDVENVTSKLMKKLGYEVTNSPVPLRRELVRKLKSRIKKIGKYFRNRLIKKL